MADNNEYATQLFNDQSISLNEKTRILFNDYKNNKSLLTKYIKLIKLYPTMSIVDCLLELEKHIQLPEEAQKIDTLVELFALNIVSSVNLPTKNEDCIYVLLYSIISLRDDLKKQTKKMKVSDFIMHNRGINDGQNLSDKYLADIYNEVAELVLFENIPIDDTPSQTVCPTLHTKKYCTIC